ncbi:MAG: thiol-disulfide oxidoreductase [Pseudopedobacter saltans]|uniref:Thiol-disulfide oxidoreductase n=1 Tax=Pseudopedobacter saltans TaxID=151895 RepID=A0A2W5FDC1_9SPHI|nr:MAG: thiol-disulfide oxidoreductase [Pseudopedobacter saltans]
MHSEDNYNIVLFDGICNLCNGAVQFILKRDKHKKFHFASLQSDTGSRMLSSFGLTDYNLQSIALISNNRIYTKSDAALLIAKDLGGIYIIISSLRVLPRFLRDKVYDFIAKNRYKWFGKREECWMPTQELKNRFL